MPVLTLSAGENLVIISVNLSENLDTIAVIQ